VYHIETASPALFPLLPVGLDAHSVSTGRPKLALAKPLGDLYKVGENTERAARKGTIAQSDKLAKVSFLETVVYELGASLDALPHA